MGPKFISILPPSGLSALPGGLASHLRQGHPFSSHSRTCVPGRLCSCSTKAGSGPECDSQTQKVRVPTEGFSQVPAALGQRRKGQQGLFCQILDREEGSEEIQKHRRIKEWGTYRVVHGLKL